MKRHAPSYDIAEVLRLVEEGKTLASRRVREWLSNQGFDASEAIREVLLAVGKGEGSFYKTDELTILPGIMADIYKVTTLGEDWYLKFYIEEEIIVLSCCIDGMIH